MTKNKAARILLNQTKKPLEDNFNFEEWMHQSYALIEKFFGKESEQYNRLHQPVIGNSSNSEIKIRPNTNRQILFICAILKCCSDTIRLNGIYKKRRLLSYIGFVSIVIVLFGAGAFWFYMKGRSIETKTVIQSKPLLIHTVSRSLNKIGVTGNY